MSDFEDLVDATGAGWVCVSQPAFVMINGCVTTEWGVQPNTVVGRKYYCTQWLSC